MKKRIILVLCCMVFLFITGCNNLSFSKISTEKEIYVNDEVSLTIKDNSINKSGLILLISNETDSDLTYDSTYYLEQKRNDVWYSSDVEQSFNALATQLKSKTTNEFEVIFVSELPPGDYRIIKPVNVSSGNISLMINFTIA